MEDCFRPKTAVDHSVKITKSRSLNLSMKAEAIQMDITVLFRYFQRSRECFFGD